MFDDTSPKQPLSPGSHGPVPGKDKQSSDPEKGGEKAPSGDAQQKETLSQGQPEDIFAETERVPVQGTSGKSGSNEKEETEAEDAHSGKGAAAFALKRNPDQPSPLRVKEKGQEKETDLPSPPSSSPPLTLEAPGVTGGRRFLLIGVIAVVSVGIGFAAWWLWKLNFPVVEDVLENQQVQPQDQQEDAADTPSGSVPQAEEKDTLPSDSQQENTESAVFPDLPPDQDADGLPDAEEELYGTNPRSSDTDGDGLYDREEVKTWRTDPTNPDTDGDGYLDGEEVKAGYNPNGSGTLQRIPQ